MKRIDVEADRRKRPRPDHRTLLAVVLMLASGGCAVSWGSGDAIHQLGFAWTAEGRSPCGNFVERTVPGLDVRLGTGDSGVALGWSRHLLARPGTLPSGESARCWTYPREHHRKRQLLWPYRKLEAPPETAADGRRLPAFLSSTTFGLSLETNDLRQNLSLLFERSTLTASDPEESLICQLRYARSLDSFHFSVAP